MTKQTWVLVADGGRARLLTTPRVLADGNFTQIAAYDNSEALEAPQSTDRPGRSFESAGSMRHAVAEYSELKKQPKLEFADELAQMLNRAADDSEFDRLIVVAPPTMMGQLRKKLSPAATRKMVGTIDKDLTAVGLDDLAQHLEGATA